PQPLPKFFEVLEECHPPFTRAVSLGSDLGHALVVAKWARLIGLSHMWDESEGVAVLGQWVRRIAVPADLPISQLFFVGERDGSEPLLALVRVVLCQEGSLGP